MSTFELFIFALGQLGASALDTMQLMGRVMRLVVVRTDGSVFIPILREDQWGGLEQEAIAFQDALKWALLDAPAPGWVAALTAEQQAAVVDFSRQLLALKRRDWEVDTVGVTAEYLMRPMESRKVMVFGLGEKTMSLGQMVQLDQKFECPYVTSQALIGLAAYFATMGDRPGAYMASKLEKAQLSPGFADKVSVKVAELKAAKRAAAKARAAAKKAGK